MPGTHRSQRSRRKSNVRWIVLAVILCSAMSCLAPVLYASNDCSRWIAEYKQGILARRAERRLRFAKYRLTNLVKKPAPVHHYPRRHPMSPLESLRHFQIACGDLTENPDLPLSPAVIGPGPAAPMLAEVSFPEAPPELPAPTVPVVGTTPEVPVLINIPMTPVENLPSPSPIPEPGSFVLVLSGALVGAEAIRRRSLRTHASNAL